jgi:CheY-like chemotaxis protein
LLRILIADDDPINQHLAYTILTNRGHEAIVVSDGKEAVTAAADSEFDLILMDVQMPEMSGFEATASIRESERNQGKRTPIVALTAGAMKGDAERCLAADMDYYVSKPFKRIELLHAVERLEMPHRKMPHHREHGRAVPV